MTPNRPTKTPNLPAPCLVDVGTLVNKQDMHRVLSNLGAVHYAFFEEEACLGQDDGYVIEVFSDPHQATLVVNHTLYLNVCSFDYIDLGRVGKESYFDLVQENRRLRLTPLTSPLHEQTEQAMGLASLEAMVSDVLASEADLKDSDLS
ncbi:MAG: hypothetical protein ACFB4J_09245 [Elainellaceae cyanobacterium]